MNMRWKLAALVAGFAAIGTASRAETTLTAVMQSDLKIVDPIWTTAYITRNHGYMVYDTLFAMDEKGEIKPQMIENYDVSVDKLVYTLVLRDGLVWHDGLAPSLADLFIVGVAPIDYGPILLLRLFGFRIAPDTLSSTGLRRWPARHYPCLWIQRPSSERWRDFNPPDSRATQHTLR
jgi:hypothetical protein